MSDNSSLSAQNHTSKAHTATQPRFIRLRDAPPISAWTRTDSTGRYGRTSSRFRSARRASRSIALTWTPGRMSIRTATGVPRLNLKGESHGKPKNVRSYQTWWVWHIDKEFRGVRIRESTGTSNVAQAEELLAKRIDEIRRPTQFGVRPDHRFRAAATKFLEENQHKKSIGDDATSEAARSLYWRSDVKAGAHGKPSAVHRQAAKGQREDQDHQRLSSSVRRIVNLAESEWRDEQGLTWIERAAKIKLLPMKDQRRPYPLSREEQAAFFRQLPDHLARMALFKVNTGCREQEVCGLRWDGK